MKVVLLAYACEPDKGSEPQVGWRWALAMARSCEVMVVTQAKNRGSIEAWLKANPNAPASLRFQYVGLGAVWGWVKRKVPGGVYAYYAVWQWRMRHRLRRWLAESPADLAHHVTFASFRMPVGVEGLPVVWGPVGGAELAPMHLLAGYGTWCGRWRERVRNLSTRMAGRCLRWWDPTRRNGGMALASTPATAALLEKAGIECRLMPTIGLDAEGEVTPPPGLAGGPLRLLFVGRLHLLKGVHLLLEAMASMGGQRVSLTVVGDGPEESRLRRQVAALGLGGVVEFRGRLARESLGEVFAAHDLVVAPSLYESGGLSVLEGFARGRPALVLDCGGHALSVNEECGVKVPVQASLREVIEMIGKAITAYERNRALLARHGLAARKRLVDHYGWERKREEMEKIYQFVAMRWAAPKRG